MTADSGYIRCSFYGPEAVLEQFRALAEQADRQAQFSMGLSWLDELDCQDQVECDAVSYDTLAATREFLEELLTALPELGFEGTLEHSWPTLAGGRTVVTFAAEDGVLRWEEHTAEEEEELPLWQPEPDEEDEDEDPSDLPYPTTPYG